MSAVTPDLYFENETFISEQILDARLVEVPDSRFLRLVFDKAISEQEKVTQRISEIGGRNYQYFIFKGRPTKPQLTKEEQAKKYQQPTKPQLAEED
ncbi:MAG TPA: hypothetical protein VLG76_04720, partial [Rhabdochlamydiaceae bacterium]|nr:hypothetical protein [Rhabdochlamydiaceae bacterium]